MKRTYVVPLRSKWRRTERHQRAKKASTELRLFLQKHMKTETVKIGRELNEHLWSRGARKPPSKVEIIVEKNDEGIVYAELPGTPLPSEQEPKETKKKKSTGKETIVEKLQEKLEAKPVKKTPTKKEDKPTEKTSPTKTEKPAEKPLPKKETKPAETKKPAPKKTTK